MTSHDKPYAIHSGFGVGLTALGIEPAHVLRRAGLPADLFAREATTLTPMEFHRFWAALDEEAADPTLPVRIGESLTADAFDVPIFAAACSPNLHVAAKRLSRYKPLIGPIVLDVQTTDRGTRLELSWPDGLSPPPLLRVVELVWWVAFARLATHHEICPLLAAAPLDTVDASVEAYLGTSIEHRPQTVLVFSTRDAARPFLTANARMWNHFEPGLRTRLSELQAGSTVDERVHSALLELLPAGNGTINAVAGSLGMSTRTLQRKLKSEGTTFRRRLNGTREMLARHYLGTSRMPVAEISFLLGYEDPNSFFRAFHGWTGSSPERMRTSLIDG